MTFDVKGLYLGIEEHERVVDGVTGKSDNVEKKEIKVETFNTLSLEVEPYLGVEGDTPGNEVDPSGDLD